MCVYLRTHWFIVQNQQTNKNTHTALQNEPLYIIYTSLNFQMI